MRSNLNFTTNGNSLCVKEVPNVSIFSGANVHFFTCETQLKSIVLRANASDFLLLDPGLKQQQQALGLAGILVKKCHNLLKSPVQKGYLSEFNHKEH